MHPIRFACARTLPFSAEEIGRRILDVAGWPEFQGAWPIPGIAHAEFEVRTPDIVGSRIRVTNRDRSTHVEEIVERSPQRIRLRMGEFSPPLSLLATGFVETWDFDPRGDATHVTRSFEMHPASFAARPILWAISLFLKRAVERHLRDIG